MFILMRALIYATLFAGVVFVFLPSRLLIWAGVGRPETTGFQQIAGMAATGAGLALALWCVVAFALAGRGTPVPLDPPVRLVTSGPYRFTRNPMYLGAGLTLAGAALFYSSLEILAYLCLLLLASHLFIVFHEEPKLARSFSDEYRNYCQTVGRWFPKI